ncbi:MAG TPA: glycosyltransferase family 39 protein, partial [Desulfobacteria bacterium]|nr:glycosyltransferase family 39 protein [Desulfobacteria bacterium]
MNNSNTKRTFILFGLLLVFALFIRTIYFIEFRQNPFFEYVHPSHDSMNVHNGAMEISKGNLLLDKKGFKYPFYSYFVAGIYSLANHKIWAIWIAQFALGAIAAALLFLIGNNLFNRNVGIIASLIYALYGPNLFYEGIMLRAALTEFLAVLSFYLLLRLESRPSYKTAFLCGASLSMMVQCRPNTVVLLPLVLFYVFFRTLKSDEGKHRLKYLTILICALIVTGMPLLLRGIHAEKKFQFYDPGGPHVFLMGNLIDYDGLGWHNGSPRFKEYLRNSGGKIHDYKWVVNEVVKEIENDPLAFLSLYLRKAYYFLCNYEIPSNNNYYIYQKFSYLLRNPLMNFAFVASLAVFGFLASLRNYRENLLLYIFVLGMTGSVLLF